MRQAVRLFLLLATMVWLAACAGSKLECQDALGCIEVRSNEPIRIAYLLAESGDAAFLGQDSRRGIELAIDDRENVVAGHPIELVGADSGCDVAQGETAVQTLTTDPSLVGIIGPSCSAVAETVMPLIHDVGLVLLSPSNTAATLTESEQSWRGSYFRTAHNDAWQAQMTATFFYRELGMTKAAVIFDGDSRYSSSLAQTFATTWRRLGGELNYERSMSAGQTEIADLIIQVSLSAPQILYLPLFEPEGNLIIGDLTTLFGEQGIILAGPDSLLVDTFPQSAGRIAQGMYVSGTAVAGDDYEAFLTGWEARFGSPPTALYHAHAYDATNILLAAIEMVAQTGNDNSVLIGRQALRRAIAATTNFNGVTGRLTCNEAGDCADGSSLGIYEINEATIEGRQWPPPLVWMP